MGKCLWSRLWAEKGGERHQPVHHHRGIRPLQALESSGAGRQGCSPGPKKGSHSVFIDPDFLALGLEHLSPVPRVMFSVLRGKGEEPQDGEGGDDGLCWISGNVTVSGMERFIWLSLRQAISTAAGGGQAVC